MNSVHLLNDPTHTIRVLLVLVRVRLTGNKQQIYYVYNPILYVSAQYTYQNQVYYNQYNSTNTTSHGEPPKSVKIEYDSL